jgi:hypothetical protein
MTSDNFATNRTGKMRDSQRDLLQSRGLSNKRQRIQMTQYETEVGRPKSAAKIPISLAGKPNLGDGTITNIQTRPDTTMWSVHRNQTHFVESSLSKLVIKENSQDMEVMEKALRAPKHEKRQSRR